MPRSFVTGAALAVAIGALAAGLATPSPGVAQLTTESRSPFADPSFTPAPLPGEAPRLPVEPRSPSGVVPPGPEAPAPGTFATHFPTGPVTGYGPGGIAREPGTPINPGYDILGGHGMR